MKKLFYRIKSKLGIIKGKLQINLFYNPLMRLRIYLAGGKIGKGCVFIGFTRVKKRRTSHINIGNNSIFLSTELSNPLGINHRCMLTALENARIQIGDGCGFSGTAVYCSESIILGNGVRCGANTLIMDSDGHLDDYRTGPNSPIIIGDNVWLGVGVTVMKGSKIGREALIGAGSVIRNVIPPYSIVLGNPAKVIGFSLTPEEILEYEKKHYSEEDRLSMDVLQRNYEKYFINRWSEIKEFTKI